ncbi:hypothetical protein [Methanolapillus ohkumae]|uniref:Uncharacterized protein n=1 Tax=Methanolapillus ohkumae TaxID=3028298 RepID=A0AA96ZVZ3_9EURY|nr:hypothetical protein MsAm2_12210 [Methanosarcinaceae archaeon Am2]
MMQDTMTQVPMEMFQIQPVSFSFEHETFSNLFVLLRLKKPLKLNIIHTGEYYIVENEELNLFSHHKDLKIAILDLEFHVYCMWEHYVLEKNEKLIPGIAEYKKLLQSFVEENNIVRSDSLSVVFIFELNEFISSKKLKFIRPLNICIMSNDGVYYAKNEELKLYSFDRDLKSAVLDIELQFCELWKDFVQVNEEKLHPTDIDFKMKLQSYAEEYDVL